MWKWLFYYAYKVEGCDSHFMGEEFVYTQHKDQHIATQKLKDEIYKKTDKKVCDFSSDLIYCVPAERMCGNVSI